MVDLASKMYNKLKKNIIVMIDWNYDESTAMLFRNLGAKRFGLTTEKEKILETKKTLCTK